MTWLWIILILGVAVGLIVWVALRQRRYAGDGTIADAKRDALRRDPQRQGGEKGPGGGWWWGG